MKLFKGIIFLRKKPKFEQLESIEEEGGDQREEIISPPPPIPTKSPRVVASNNGEHRTAAADPTANLFDQKFVPEGYPKMEFHTKKIIYKYPSKRVQKKYGLGLQCAYCFAEFVHNAPRAPKRPCLITNCYHIVCADCITLNSRPLLVNLDPATCREHPFIFGRLSSSGMQCPACNKDFTWANVYNFYL